MSQWTNRLSKSDSPYLLQHQHNPVDWWQWEDGAFDEASRRDAPIFLSIGYSTCHWCHVMERESFENEKIATLLNKYFVCIKVDREERPDVDHIYMTAAQLMGIRGGWPLSIMMTPSKKPFFAATYIPPTSGRGRTGMDELIPHVGELWRTDRTKILTSTDSIFGAMEKVLAKNKPAADKNIDDGIFDRVQAKFETTFDRVNGGFGGAPKFPTAHHLLLLMRIATRSKDSVAIEMVRTTLKKMRLGGIWDHVGFGFHRYSTDSEWLLPHFEKMLYDQAMLMLAYAEAYQVVGDPLFRATVLEIADYVKRELTSEYGSFFSAENADSEGREGAFYVWLAEKLGEFLGPEDLNFLNTAFGVSEAGNFADESTGVTTGENILHLKEELVEYQQERWERLRRKLHHHREKRIRPSLDDKVLTDWNGLMIGALAYAGRAVGEPDMVAMASRSARVFLRYFESDHELPHSVRKSRVTQAGMLDDYAFMGFACIELYHASGDPEFLTTAINLTKTQRNLFWNDDYGGYQSARREDLPINAINWDDGAIPSGNAISYYNLVRLYALTGDSTYLVTADEMEKVFSDKLAQFPTAYSGFLLGRWQREGRGIEIVLTGERKTTDNFEDVLRTTYLPAAVIHRLTSENHLPLSAIAPYLESFDVEIPSAHVCSQFTCQLPATEAAVFRQQLESVG